MIYFVFLDTLGIRSFQGSLTLTVFRIRQSIPDPGYKKPPGSGSVFSRFGSGPRKNTPNLKHWFLISFFFILSGSKLAHKN